MKLETRIWFWFGYTAISVFFLGCLGAIAFRIHNWSLLILTVVATVILTYMARRVGRNYRDSKLDQFPEVKMGLLTIEGEEKILDLLTNGLARHGIAVTSDKEFMTHYFSFWTRDSNPGVPIRSGVRLMINAGRMDVAGGKIVGDEIVNRSFMEAEDFASFVTRWIVSRLKQSQPATA